MLAYTVGNTNMLSIKNIHKQFGSVHAMNNISLDLKPGLFGLLGPNGAGKSTLMRTLATLQKPDSGTITYNGVSNSPVSGLNFTVPALHNCIGKYKVKMNVVRSSLSGHAPGRNASRNMTRQPVRVPRAE